MSTPAFQITRPLVLNHIVSPYGIASISTIIFLLAWAFPPNLYSALMSEPDLIFLDAQTLLYFVLCIAGFGAGLLLIDFLFPTPALLDSNFRSSELGSFCLSLPLLVTSGMTALLIVQMLRNYPDTLFLLFSQQGDVIKAQQAADVPLGPLGWASVVHTVVLWWTYWKGVTSRPVGPASARSGWLVWLVLTIGILVQLALSTVKVSRSDLMPACGGLAVLYLMKKIRYREIRTGALLRFLFLFPFAVILLFSLFGVLRGTDAPTAGLESFTGYTLSSYNRLTALLRGTMRYPYGGHGLYLSTFLGYNHALNSLVPIRRIMGWPEDFMNFWNSDFQAPELAGLRYDLTWSGAFGYLFSDFGWGTPLVLVVYGLLYGVLWGRVKAGSTLGVVLYPWFAFCALSWFSGNIVFDFRFPQFVVVAVLLMVYEGLAGMTLSIRPLRPAHRTLP